MVEIIHKMAPKARLGFASGSALGEVAFGNSIRQLAQLPGYPGISGFRADVIVDDISYGGEPFYGESIIGNAIDEAAAAGVSWYFSSAGNNIGINALEVGLAHRAERHRPERRRRQHGAGRHQHRPHWRAGESLRRRLQLQPGQRTARRGAVGEHAGVGHVEHRDTSGTIPTTCANSR